MTVPQRRAPGPGKPLDAGVFQPGIGSFRLHLAAEGKAARTCGPAPRRCIPASDQAPGERPGPDQRPDHRGPGTGSRDELPGSTPPAEPGIRRCAPLRSHSGGGTGRSTASRPALDHRRGMQQGPVAAAAARPSRTCGRACARGWLGLVVTDAGRPGPDRVPVPQVASPLTVPRRGVRAPEHRDSGRPQPVALGEGAVQLAPRALPCLLARIPRSHPEHRDGDGQQLLAVPLQEPVGVAVPSSGVDRRAARPDPGHRSARARRVLAAGPPGRPPPGGSSRPPRPPPGSIRV